MDVLVYTQASISSVTGVSRRRHSSSCIFHKPPQHLDNVDLLCDDQKLRKSECLKKIELLGQDLDRLHLGDRNGDESISSFKERINASSDKTSTAGGNNCNNTLLVPERHDGRLLNVSSCNGTEVTNRLLRRRHSENCALLPNPITGRRPSSLVFSPDKYNEKSVGNPKPRGRRSNSLYAVRNSITSRDKLVEGSISNQAASDDCQYSLFDISDSFKSREKFVENLIEEHERIANFTEEELKQLCRYFWSSDVNGSGKLTPYDFSQLVQHLGMKLSSRDLQQAFTAADVDGDGLISFNDFLSTYLNRDICKFMSPEQIKQSFSKSGNTDNIYLSKQECIQIMKMLGNYSDDKKLGRMMRLVDKDTNDQITLNRFYFFLGYSL